MGKIKQFSYKGKQGRRVGRMIFKKPVQQCQTMDDLSSYDLEGNERQPLGFKHQSNTITCIFQNLMHRL